jgi:hypothetical protein
MADKDCNEACVAAYKARVSRLFDVLSECLLEAGDDAAKQKCKDTFRRGLRAAREARDICISLCDE